MTINKDELINYLLTTTMIKNCLISVVLITIAVIAKSLWKKKLNKDKDINRVDAALLRRNINNYVNAFLIISLTILWFSQIHSILVSLLAVTAALVLATKEIIMSVMGGLLVRANNHFSVGDRIEVGGVRGFVVKKSLTVTKVLEIGPEKNSQQTTGDIITVPNGIMLSNPVRNESYFKDYSIKSFTLKIPEGMVFEHFEEEILKWANSIVDDYVADAKKLIESFCEKEGIALPTINPRCKIIMNKDGLFDLLLKLPVPNALVADVEQKLYRFYLSLEQSSIAPSNDKLTP